MNVKDKKIAVDGEGFAVLLNADETGGYVSCGEECHDVTDAQAEKLIKGEIDILADLFDYNDFHAA